MGHSNLPNILKKFFNERRRKTVSEPKSPIEFDLPSPKHSSAQQNNYRHSHKESTAYQKKLQLEDFHIEEEKCDQITSLPKHSKRRSWFLERFDSVGIMNRNSLDLRKTHQNRLTFDFEDLIREETNKDITIKLSLTPEFLKDGHSSYPAAQKNLA
jgi:hypothetical protein